MDMRKFMRRKELGKEQNIFGAKVGIGRNLAACFAQYAQVWRWIKEFKAIGENGAHAEIWRRGGHEGGR
jgi:hypothetical protein